MLWKKQASVKVPGKVAESEKQLVPQNEANGGGDEGGNKSSPPQRQGTTKKKARRMPHPPNNVSSKDFKMALVMVAIVMVFLFCHLPR